MDPYSVVSDGTHRFKVGGPGGHWEVIYTLAAADGQPVITEMRVRARRGKPVPGGGLSTRFLRAIRLGEHLAQISSRLKQGLVEGRPVEDRTTVIEAGPGHTGGIRVDESPADFLREAAEQLGMTEPPSERKRRGRPGRSDYDYARLASKYVDAIARGSRYPVKDLAKSESYSASHVRDAIHTARERGLLTRTAAKGRAGGELTKKAIAVLDSAGGAQSRSVPNRAPDTPWWLRRPGDQA
jgi:hypothetical protein